MGGGVKWKDKIIKRKKKNHTKIARKITRNPEIVRVILFINGAKKELMEGKSCKSVFRGLKVQNFIMATRDSGYKNTASALAELIDNSLEAEATTIEINIIKTDVSGDNEFLFHIIDNGRGMIPNELNQALQFGGSSKFNSRRSLGRYGMGLPNSSLSQARRVEVITWKSPSSIYRCYLDADEVAAGKIKVLPKPEKVSANEVMIHSGSGTMVKWLKCDRISNKNLKTLIKNLHFELGRVFRHHIWEGKKITINNELILPVDPLFLRSGMNIMGAVQYGKPLKYQVKIPGGEASSEITVRFVELPLEEWTKYSNEEKNKLMLSKWAGVSILRANREIDYGWYFMGGKRKENYDDWWRCEISFNPELDELFGVTHTKQEIHPTEAIKNILSQDMEQIARDLLHRVRNRFIEVKQRENKSSAKSEIEKVDYFIEPPYMRINSDEKENIKSHAI